MKKLIASLVLVAGATAAFSQGSINFFTFNSNTALGTAFLPGGVTPVPSSYYGQLWWSDTSGGTYAPVGTPTAFSVGSPGYVNSGTVTIPGRDNGSILFFQMRVWNTSAGATWAAAGGDTPGSNPLLIAYGISQNKSRTIGGGFDTDGNFVPQPQFNNFANFSLTAVAPVPEPSTIALAGLGFTSLLLFRRKK